MPTAPTGVFGAGGPTGHGVTGISCSGIGVFGSSESGCGIHGKSCSGYGVQGSSSYSCGVNGESQCGYGVSGSSTALSGVHGSSVKGAGVFAEGCRVGVFALARTPSAIPIVASAAPCQSANLQQWNNCRCNPISVVNKSGWLGLGRPCAPTTLAVAGSVSANVQTSCVPYAMGQSDFAVLANAGVTLPAASTARGMIVFIKNINASSITVSAHGSDKIEGKASQTLKKEYSSLTLISDGSSKWYILSNAT